MDFAKCAGQQINEWQIWEEVRGITMPAVRFQLLKWMLQVAQHKQKFLRFVNLFVCNGGTIGLPALLPGGRSRGERHGSLNAWMGQDFVRDSGLDV